MGEVLQVPPVADALALLPASRWVVVGDTAWPTPLLGDADRVVIGPGGVFVVVEVDSRERPATVLLDAPWVEGEFRGDLVERAENAAAAVLHTVPGVDPAHVRPVLCFVQEPMLLERCDDVLVCSTSNVVSLLVSRPPVLSVRQVHTVHARMRAGLRRAVAGLQQVPQQAGSPDSERLRARGLVAGIAVALVLLVAAGLGLAAAELGGSGAGIVGIGALVDGTPRTSAAPSLGRPVLLAGQVQATVLGVHRVAGQPLVEVRLELLTVSGRARAVHPARSLWLVAGSGRRFAGSSPARVRGVVPAARLLPAATRLRPGRPVRGTVLVAVPAGTRIAQVGLRLGEGRAGWATWSVR
ncbi:MAG TPA: hypothetical protein VFM09_06060 [Marmoricola sp.]|nr:hypothetical protein [Marmoricola sp.]